MNGSAKLRGKTILLLAKGGYFKMDTYETVKGSRGHASQFAITVGLEEHDRLSTEHTPDEAEQLIRQYLKQCIEEGKPYLQGSVSTSRAIRAWQADRWAHSMGEDQATYSGTTVPTQHGFTSYDQIVEFLERLADYLADKLNQSTVQIVLENEIWIRQKKIAATPVSGTA